MGVNINQVLALCFGFGALMAGIGGSLISICYPIQPTMGFQYTMIAIIVIVLGGLGSIPGSFIRGSFTGSCWQHRYRYRAGLITGCLLFHLHASAPGEAKRYFGEIDPVRKEFCNGIRK